MDNAKYIDVVFDGPPSHVSGRFVEVEDDQGKSVHVGEWIGPPEDSNPFEGVPFWRLRIPCDDFYDMDRLAAEIHEISTGKGFTPPSLKNLPQKLLLSVSELVEAMEEDRSGKGLIYFKCVVCGVEYKNIDEALDVCRADGLKPEGILVEIADSTIRNLHMVHSLIEEYNKVSPEPFKYRVSDVHEIKVAYNEGRPHLHGGRAY